MFLSGLNSGGTNKKSVGANSSVSRKSDTSVGCGAYNADYQSDDSILEDRADNSVTKVECSEVCCDKPCLFLSPVAAARGGASRRRVSWSGQTCDR